MMHEGALAGRDRVATRHWRDARDLIVLDDPLLRTIAVDGRALPVEQPVAREEAVAAQLVRVVQAHMRLLEDAP